MNLIELTTAVICCTSAVDKKGKARNLIKRGIDQYIAWAAVDGGYDKLDFIPNIITAVANVGHGGGDITAWMETQLRDLARKHRDSLRIEDDDQDCPRGHRDTLRDGYRDEDEDELAKAMLDTPKALRPPRYRRPPPVLYGIFVVQTTAMVLTMDAAKDHSDIFMSYQVEVGFNRKDQGVWNAITLAVVVCLARDWVAERKDDFETLRLDSESDPDV